jgi:hypothetical protein
MKATEKNVFVSFIFAFVPFVFAVPVGYATFSRADRRHAEMSPRTLL